MQVSSARYPSRCPPLIFLSRKRKMVLIHQSFSFLIMATNVVLRGVMVQSHPVNNVLAQRKAMLVNTMMGRARQELNCFVKILFAWSKGFESSKILNMYHQPSCCTIPMRIHAQGHLRHLSVHLGTHPCVHPTPLSLQVRTSLKTKCSCLMSSTESSPASPNASWISLQALSSPSPSVFAPELFFDEQQSRFQPPLELAQML